MNKYERKPECILDLHGHTTKEAQQLINELMHTGKFGHVRLITGKGTFRETGPVMRTFVKKYLQSLNIPFSTSKLADGGEGALEVFFK